MKLTRKLSLAVGLGICVVLGTHAWTRLAADRTSFRADMERDHDVLGRSLASVVEMLWQAEGMMRALAAVERQNARTSNVSIRWVEAGEGARAIEAPRHPALMLGPGEAKRSTVVSIRGTPHMVTYVRVRVPTRATTAIELVESLSGEREFQRRSLKRAALTTTALILLCLALTIGFGAIFVARPLRLVVRKAERIGEGDLEGPIELENDDEIRDLARTINEMCDRLRDARDRERVAVEARIAAVEQLRHADRLRTVGEIASGVAHELGTPLNVVRVRGAMIAAGEVPEARMRELGHVIVEQADRISASIRQLLDYARRVPSQRADVLVDDVTRRVVSMVAPMANKRGVALALGAPAPGLRVHADANQLEQAVTNVVVNALQASEPGGEVTVLSRRDGDDAVIEVVDRGSGIPAEDLAHVVEPFFTRKRAGEGTGLGLPIASGIVRDHGGELVITSAVGAGTTVTLRLPART